MESASTSTASYEHSLPHQQFTSLLAFTGRTRKAQSFPTKKSTRLPPIGRRDSTVRPEEANEVRSPSNGSVDSSEEPSEPSDGFDPYVRIRQLERNIAFFKENAQQLLKGLHYELEDLKVKNRDLQFQLITNDLHHLQNIKKEQLVIPLIKESLPPEVIKHINKLDTEVKQLRYTLCETIKLNAALQKEVLKLKNSKEDNERNQFSLTNKELVKSPPIGDFVETLRKIYETNTNTIYLPRIAKHTK